MAGTQNIKLLQAVSHSINSLLHHPVEMKKLYWGVRVELMPHPYSPQYTHLIASVGSLFRYREVTNGCSWGNVTSNVLLKSQADILLKNKLLKNDT